MGKVNVDRYKRYAKIVFFECAAVGPFIDFSSIHSKTKFGQMCRFCEWKALAISYEKRHIYVYCVSQLFLETPAFGIFLRKDIMLFIHSWYRFQKLLHIAYNDLLFQNLLKVMSNVNRILCNKGMWDNRNNQKKHQKWNYTLFH